MAFQLTLSKTTMPAAEALKRKTVVTVSGQEASLGPETATCPIPDFDSAVPLTITLTEEGRHALHASPMIQLNGEPCGTEPMPIRSGDIITCGHWNVQFHVCHPKVNQSWKSSILATGSKVAIALIMMAVAAAMFWLPNYLANHDTWGNHAAMEELSATLDQARKNVKIISQDKKLNTMDALLLEHISHELDSRVRYVRRYGRRLNPRQRQALVQDARKLIALLEKSLAHEKRYELPKPALDKAVRTIIADKFPPRTPTGRREDPNIHNR